jgi:hypothetical protein
MVERFQVSKCRKEKQQIIERLWDFLKESRFGRQAGKSRWPLAFAALSACFMVWLAHPFAQTRILCSLPQCASPREELDVVEVYNPKSILFQEVIDGVPQVPVVRHFDVKTPFVPGFRISWLKYQDRGDVWAVAGFDPYFKLVRDKDGIPVTAKNCPELQDSDGKWYVKCDGEPQF